MAPVQLCDGQAEATDNEHVCTLPVAIRMQRDGNEILTVMSFIHRRRVMLQHDNAQPHTAAIPAQVSKLCAAC